MEHDIVFDDLHGMKEDTPVTVNLDAGEKEDAIQRKPADQAAEAGGEGDDFDDLRPGDADEQQSAAQSADDDEASNTSDDDAYGKKVQARIQRERRAKKKAQDEATYWKQQAQKMAKDNSSREREDLKSRIEQADTEIESTQSMLKAAIENGDTDKQVDLTSKLTDLKAAKIQAQYGLDNLPEDGNVPPFDGNVAPPSDETGSPAEKWVTERSDWYRATGFEKQTRIANRIDKEVMRDGFDPNTEEYFEELDSRLKKVLPDMYDEAPAPEDKGGDDDNDHETPVSPVGGVDTNASNRGKGRSSKVELTEADFANMRRFNLDTSDPEVLKEYARNKAQGA